MMHLALIGLRSTNQLSNSRFDNALTGWSTITTPTTLEQTAQGQAHIIADSNGDGMGQAVSLVAGRKYELSFNYDVVSGGLNVSKVGMTSIASLTGAGRHRLIFTESDGTSRNTLFQLNGAGEVYLDNIRMVKTF